MSEISNNGLLFAMIASIMITIWFILWIASMIERKIYELQRSINKLETILKWK